MNKHRNKIAKEYARKTKWSDFIGIFVIFIFSVLFSFDVLAETKTEAVDWLAEAIYFESRDQILIGQIAVGCVIKARVKSRRWPNTVRGVVHQRKQFSYYSDGKPEIFREHAAHYVAVMMAEHVLNTNACDMFGGADHYLNHDIANPNEEWFKKMAFIMKVDAHSFYKSK